MSTTMAHYGQNNQLGVPNNNNSNNNSNNNRMTPLIPSDEGGGRAAKFSADNSSAFRGSYMMGQGSGSGSGGGFMMNKGGPASSWSGEQRMPPSYRSDICNDVGSQPANDSMCTSNGIGNGRSYSNYSNAGPGRSGVGMSNFQGDGESINYLAARAHAAQMLAAEESRRLEENLILLEMRRRMMIGGGGSGMMNGGENGLRAGQDVQRSNNGSAGTISNGNDSMLMARAQKFNVPQSQTNMINGYSNSNQPRSMGMESSNWNSVGNNRNFLQCLNTSNNQPPFAPLKSREEMKSPGEAIACQVSQSCPSTTTPADSPKPIKTTVAPRRPLSAYNIFFSEMREIILKENENGDGSKSTEKSKENSSEADKCNTKKVAGENADKPKDMEAFTQNLMRKRLHKEPKKRVHRKSHGKVAFTTLAKTVGMRWRELSEEKKKKYKDLAEIDRTRYRKEKLAVGKILKEEAKKQRKEAKARQMMT